MRSDELVFRSLALIAAIIAALAILDGVYYATLPTAALLLALVLFLLALLLRKLLTRG